MGFLKCLVYIAVLGVCSFILGRLVPKSWFHHERFPYRCAPWEQKLFKALTGFDKRLTLNAALPVTLTLKDPTLNREDLLMLCVKVMERLLARMELSAA